MAFSMAMEAATVMDWNIGIKNSGLEKMRQRRREEQRKKGDLPEGEEGA